MHDIDPIAATDYRRIVSRAAALLSESSDFGETLAQTLLGCLPSLGDFGFFDARRDGDVMRLARAHEDEETEAILRPTKWIPQERSDMNLCALSTGRPAFHGDIDDGWYQAVATSPAHLEILRKLAFKSMISVPMRHAGELIGALTLFMGKSGRRHHAEHLEMLSDLAGIAAPVVANARLVERHRLAENDLRASQHRLELAFHAAGLGAWEWSLESGAVYWSPEYRDIYGFDPDEAPTFDRGMSVVHEEDRSSVIEHLRRAMDGGSGFTFEHRVVHPARGLRWVQTLGRAQTEAGRTVGMHGVVMDITGKKLQEGELRHLRDRLGEELAAVRKLHAVSTRVVRREDRLDDLLQEILEAALEITGRTRGSIRLADEQRGVLRMVAHKGFDAGFHRRFGEIPFDIQMASAAAWRSGQRVTIDDVEQEAGGAYTAGIAAMREARVRALQSTPLIARDGRIIGVFTTHSDQPQPWSVGELRMLDLLSREAADLIERAQSQALLNDSDRRKNEFLAILAHELRNPLAPLRYAISLSPDADEVQAPRLHQVMDRQVRHMTRLLDDLLDISRIERGTVTLKKSSVSLAGIVAAAQDASRPLVEAKGHRVSIALPTDDIILTADPVRLTQVLTNLLSNAAKYSDPGGEISVRAESTGEKVRIVVRDRGIGISADIRPRLFTLFSQGDGAAQRGEGGLGIGLALVRAFVELHGGTVEVRSEGPGLGSEFEVVLPQGAPGALAAASGGQPTPTAHSRLQVVIADDNADIVDTCAMLVGMWGHDAHTAADGVEALDLIRRVRPDVALLDIGMPRMNGHEVAAKVREEMGSSLLLIAVTGWGQEDARQQSRHAGFDMHLTKPLDADQLAGIMHAAAQRRDKTIAGP